MAPNTQTTQRLKQVAAVLYGLPFVVIGIQHFLDPSWFEPIVPEVLGSPRFWVLVSGVPEVGLGLAIMFPRSRKLAAMGIVAMLVVLYWANLNMWIHDIEIGGVRLSNTGHIIRGLVQALLIAVALWLGAIGPFRSQPDRGIEDQ
ncbi:MAG TPA: hypothetical protein DIU15_04205 [Deltaproteobacteria bacterium]|nr:hypothetical protein [Deltaproteobacteria bacterium]HCP45217.1 hypothetical protein [Deltaproteobacteria bacterium]|tara:strand:+ start:1446 stop:1880 length:435 start_codon:yes stop_codon:yes gene_type:complete